MDLLKTAAPEEVGIPSRGILELLEELKEKHIPMHSFLLWRQDRFIVEGYYAPCKRDDLHRMFSVTKSFVSAAVGILCDRGLCSLDDPIINYFPEYLPRTVHPWLAQTTIRHMLMMRSCHASSTYKRDLKANWVQSFFTVTPTHRPGTVFHYDSSAAHVLGALVEKLTGKKLLDFLREAFLDEIGFSKKAYILEDPSGTSMGGSGLMATSRDLLLFAILIANGGELNGKQYIPAWYLKEAVSFRTPNCATGPIPEECLGYGYQFWRGRHSSIFCYGMGGQLAIILPQYRLVCVTTADTQDYAGGNQVIFDAIYEHLLPMLEGHPLSGSRDWSSVLKHYLGRLTIAPLPRSLALPLPENADDRFNAYSNPDQDRFDRVPYRIVDPSRGPIQSPDHTDEAFPVCIRGFLSVSFTFCQAGGVLSYSYNQSDCELAFGFGHMMEGRFPIYGMKCAASAAWLSPSCLYIRIHLLDTSVGLIHIQAYFGDGDVTLFLRKQEETLFSEFSGHLYGVMEKIIADDVM